MDELQRETVSVSVAEFTQAKSHTTLDYIGKVQPHYCGSVPASSGQGNSCLLISYFRSLHKAHDYR